LTDLRFKVKTVKCRSRAASPGLLVGNIPEAVQLPGGNLALPWRRFPEWLRQRLEE